MKKYIILLNLIVASLFIASCSSKPEYALIETTKATVVLATEKATTIQSEVKLVAETTVSENGGLTKDEEKIIDQKRNMWAMTKEELANPIKYDGLYNAGEIDKEKAKKLSLDFMKELVKVPSDLSKFLTPNLKKEIEYASRLHDADMISLSQDPYFIESDIKNGKLGVEVLDNGFVKVSTSDNKYVCFLHFINVDGNYEINAISSINGDNSFITRFSHKEKLDDNDNKLFNLFTKYFKWCDDNGFIS